MSESKHTNPFLDEYDEQAILAQQRRLPNPFFESYNADIGGSALVPTVPDIDIVLKEQILKDIKRCDFVAFYAKVVPLMSDANLPLFCEIIPLALKKGMLCEFVIVEGIKTTFMGAIIYYGATNLARFVIKMEPTLGHAFCVQYPPLHVAILKGWPEMVQLLFDNGVSPNAIDLKGRNAEAFIDSRIKKGISNSKLWAIADLVHKQIKPDQHLLSPPTESTEAVDQYHFVASEVSVPISAETPEWQMTTVL